MASLQIEWNFTNRVALETSPARSECDTLVSKIRGLSLVSDMSL